MTTVLCESCPWVVIFRIKSKVFLTFIVRMGMNSVVVYYFL